MWLLCLWWLQDLLPQSQHDSMTGGAEGQEGRVTPTGLIQSAKLQVSHSLVLLTISTATAPVLV